MSSRAHGRLPGNVFEKAQVKSYYKSPRRTAPIRSTSWKLLDVWRQFHEVEACKDKTAASIRDRASLVPSDHALAVGIVCGVKSLIRFSHQTRIVQYRERAPAIPGGETAVLELLLQKGRGIREEADGVSAVRHRD